MIVRFIFLVKKYLNLEIIIKSSESLIQYQLKFLLRIMNKITSLKQIGSYRPKALSAEAHNVLVKQLNQFKLSPDHSYLKVTY